MRTEIPRWLATALARARPPVDRLHRWLGRGGASPRWTLAALALAALVGAGYVLVADAPVEPAWLDNGRQFPRSDREQVVHALEAKGFRPTLAGNGRIGVPADRLAEAQGVLEKEGLRPSSVKTIIDEPIEAGPFDLPSDVEQRRLRHRARSVEEAIQTYDSTLSASVSLRRVRNRTRGLGLGPADELWASVYLEVDSDRPIPPRTVEVIQSYLLTFESELGPDRIRIVDSRGHTYLDPANPASFSRSLAEARREELEGEIASQLDWIEGVRVSVRLGPPRPPAPRAEASAIMAPNIPLELEPEATAAPASSEVGPARVLVQVPIGSYSRSFRLNGADREPSRVDLVTNASRVDEVIRKTVAQLIPAEDFASIEIVRIDVPAPSEATPGSSAASTTRPIPWWAAIAAVGGLGALAFGAVRLLTPRRPLRSARASQGRRVDRGEAVGAGPGPSERVRELVRLDPEAAAGVLQRWIGQGGNPE